MDRRRFLQIAATAGLGTAVNRGDLLAQYRVLDPVRVPHSLQQYPNRDWTPGRAADVVSFGRAILNPGPWRHRPAWTPT